MSMAVATLLVMIDQLAEFIRTATLAEAGPNLSASIDRTFVAPGDRWAVEGCRQWVVHYVTSRQGDVLGGGPIPATAGAGLSGPSASVETHDFVATFVACGWPTPEDPTVPEPPERLNAWSQSFLADVWLWNRALRGLVFPPNMVGVPGLKASVGQSQPLAPQGMVGRVAWPLSVSPMT